MFAEIAVSLQPDLVRQLSIIFFLHLNKQMRRLENRRGSNAHKLKKLKNSKNRLWKRLH